MRTEFPSKGRITARDWEVLSAYLDSQLSTKESENLESRLESDSELNDALIDLQKLRTLFKDQGMVLVPRHFTLNPEMAGVRPIVRRHPSPFSVLRLASVVATICLVLLSLSELMIIGMPSSKMAQPVSKEIMMTEGFMEPPSSAPIEGEGLDERRADQATEAPVFMEAPIAAAPIEPTRETAGNVIEESPLTTDEVSEKIETPSSWMATITPTNLATDEQSLTASMTTPTSIHGSEEGITPSQIEGEVPMDESGWSFLDSLKVILIVIAVTTGISAIYLSRKNRS